MRQWTVPVQFMSEAVVQAEFYMAAQQIGLRCTLELTTHQGRLDLVVFNEDWTKILAIVECKYMPFRKMYRNRQIDRYKRLGVPVYGLSKVDRALHLATVIKNANHAGLPVESVPINRFNTRTKVSRTDRRNGFEKTIDRLAYELDEDVNFRK